MANKKSGNKFKRSALLVGGIMAITVFTGFAQQWQGYSRLPSRYDKGMALTTAFKQAKTPLLVEFYSDACATCQQITPIVHGVAGHMHNQLTMVMVDVTNPDNQMVAQLFGVTTIPKVFVFNPKKMKKQAIPDAALGSPQTLEAALNKVLTTATPH
jgi:thiol:disulfide interchange protein